MPVYVDYLRNWGWKLRGSIRRSCHLVADSKEELFEFATQRLGMKKEWYQPKSMPHFDLTVIKRMKALKRGAIELERKEFVTKLREIQQKVRDGEWQ